MVTTALRPCSKTRAITRCSSRPRRFTTRYTERVNRGGGKQQTGRGMMAGYGRLRWAAAALCFAMAGLPAAPARAGSVLLQNIGIGGAAFTMNVESFQEKKYQ